MGYDDKPTETFRPVRASYQGKIYAAPHLSPQMFYLCSRPPDHAGKQSVKDRG